MKKYEFSASLMCMDFLEAKEDIKTLNKYMDYYHIDIIDGVYSNNLSLSPDILKSYSSALEKPVDVHLATVDPTVWIPSCVEAGADTITVQADAIVKEAFRVVSMIESYGCKVGLAINPLLPLDVFRNILPRVDLLTIMMVDPGFPGQVFVDEALTNIKVAKDLREENGYKYKIQVDGSVNKNTYKAMFDNGAEIFVLGSSGLFGIEENLEKACKKAHQEFIEATSLNTERNE